MEFKNLLETRDLPDLGPGPRPGVTSQDALNRQLDGLLRDAELPVRAASLVRALVLLWHDHLDASHEISQTLGTSDASLLHGMMHRREPDYGNAKYWFGQAGDHASFRALAAGAGALLEGAAETNALKVQLLPRGEWNARAFVDACEAVARRPDETRARLLRELQRLEFHAVLDHLSGLAQRSPKTGQ
ncbi:hypothetical protein LVJ94_12710 [Pendulispora rubella]|uniref:Uncharacterized protein n=1 Tax=Pendulispora rubella TaxID=2741070 RepID=A0ABZ2LBD2_9BACT